MEDLNITKVQVDDPRIKSLGYDAEHQVLEVEFVPRQQGNTETNTVRFNTVPQDVYDELAAADPISDYYDRNIKAKYPNNHPQNY